MLKQTTRKFAIIATVVFACVAVAACGSTGSAGNDARMTKDVNAKKSVVTTAEEKTEATTTTSSTETTTSKSETSTTTTTTTETTTSEPEKTEEVTTTIEATTTTAEPEITETEATTADNPDGMYPMPECFKRKVEEYSGGEVTNVEMDQEYGTYAAQTENGQKYIYYIGKRENYESGVITNIDDYILSDSTVPGYDGIIVYAPKE